LEERIAATNTTINTNSWSHRMKERRVLCW
jgi:hypothetical protein